MSQSTLKVLEKSGNLSTSAYPIFYLIYVNALAVAAFHAKKKKLSQALDDWGHYCAETTNKAPIERGQTMKASDFKKHRGH